RRRAVPAVRRRTTGHLLHQRDERLEGRGMNGEERTYSAYGGLIVRLAHARWFVVIPLTSAALAGVLTLVFGRDWVAESSFAPQSSGGASSRIASLASQLGVAIPGLESEDASIDFYLRLARSRVLLERLALNEYAFPLELEGSDSARGNLIARYGVKGRAEAGRLGSVVARLRRATAAGADGSARGVTVRTTGPWAGLAVQINREVLAGIDEFNRERRNSEAA